MVDKYKVPKFPISGDYLKKHGYETGEAFHRLSPHTVACWVGQGVANRIIASTFDYCWYTGLTLSRSTHSNGLTSTPGL